MKNLLLGIIFGSTLTAGLVGAGDYLHPSETQTILNDIRVREALETINMQRQNYLDQQVREAGKTPCR